MVAFQYGSVVFFNFDDDEEEAALSAVRKYCTDEFRETRKDGTCYTDHDFSNAFMALRIDQLVCNWQSSVVRNVFRGWTLYFSLKVRLCYLKIIQL